MSADGRGERLTVQDARSLLYDQTQKDEGRVYGPAEPALALGAGLIYSGIRYPVFEAARQIFLTVAGVVLVLTHECDIDQANVRPFTNDVLVLPLVPFETWYPKLQAAKDDPDIRGYLGDLGAHRVSQLVYFPPFPDVFPLGGIAYLNRITCTDVSAFRIDGAQRRGALTGYGLSVIDGRLANHLQREKADRLPLDPWPNPQRAP